MVTEHQNRNLYNTYGRKIVDNDDKKTNKTSDTETTIETNFWAFVINKLESTNWKQKRHLIVKS